MFAGGQRLRQNHVAELVAGLETPTTGSIIANGQPVTGTGVDRVLMFQEAALFPWLTVQDNVKFGLRQMRTPSAEQTQRLPKPGLTG